MSSSDCAFEHKPSDFIISTPESLRQFYSQIRKERNAPRFSRTMKLCFRLLAHIKTGTVNIITPDGRKVSFTGDFEGPEGTVIIHNDKAVRRFLTGGHRGFCEAYLKREWDSPDIAVFFEVILRNVDQMRKTFYGSPMTRAFYAFIHKFRANSIKGSKKNITAHYDIGNDFYEKWLDPTMTYSSALFAADTDSLEQAQVNKYAAMAESMELEKGMSVLEIGCGWGGFAEYLGRNYDVNVTAVTISQAQYDYARKRIDMAGLSGKVSIVLKDYRELDGTYDRIGSIEMLEAVGEKYWPIFFKAVHSLLKDTGRAVIQTITIDDAVFPQYRKSADFIQRYIFPGGMLPSPSALKAQISQAGLTAHSPYSFGRDYAKTLNFWRKTFQARWPEIKKDGLNDNFKRLWELYLAYCEAGFRVGRTDVIQIPLVKA